VGDCRTFLFVLIVHEEAMGHRLGRFMRVACCAAALQLHMALPSRGGVVIPDTNVGASESLREAFQSAPSLIEIQAVSRTPDFVTDFSILSRSSRAMDEAVAARPSQTVAIGVKSNMGIGSLDAPTLKLGSEADAAAIPLPPPWASGATGLAIAMLIVANVSAASRRRAISST
jgi:hypothetical protein